MHFQKIKSLHPAFPLHPLPRPPHDSRVTPERRDAYPTIQPCSRPRQRARAHAVQGGLRPYGHPARGCGGHHAVRATGDGDVKGKRDEGRITITTAHILPRLPTRPCFISKHGARDGGGRRLARGGAFCARRQRLAPAGGERRDGRQGRGRVQGGRRRPAQVPVGGGQGVRGWWRRRRRARSARRHPLPRCHVQPPPPAHHHRRTVRRPAGGKLHRWHDHRVGRRRRGGGRARRGRARDCSRRAVRPPGGRRPAHSHRKHARLHIHTPRPRRRRRRGGRRGRLRRSQRSQQAPRRAPLPPRIRVRRRRGVRIQHKERDGGQAAVGQAGAGGGRGWGVANEGGGHTTAARAAATRVR